MYLYIGRNVEFRGSKKLQKERKKNRQIARALVKKIHGGLICLMYCASIEIYSTQLSTCLYLYKHTYTY